MESDPGSSAYPHQSVDMDVDVPQFPFPRDIKIRPDLEACFEVESHAEGTIRCKLAGRDECKALAMKYNSRGWYNFERHLVTVHKLSKERFTTDGRLLAESSSAAYQSGTFPRSSGSIKVKVRPDLEAYFEVVSGDPEDGALRCKLAGRNECKFDGIAFSMKSNPSRGWYNFERHLIKIHKFPKEMFIKDKMLTSVGDLGTMADAEDNTATPERFCLACLTLTTFTPSDLADTGSSSVDDDELRDHFPGCEGSARLSRQLLYIFFLRNILDFPMPKCERFLRRCRGVTMPENWFLLCGPCKDLVLKASAIHRKIVLLEKQLQDVKDMVKGTIRDSEAFVSAVGLNKTEIEIRNYVCGCDKSNNKKQKDTTHTTFSGNDWFVSPKEATTKEQEFSGLGNDMDTDGNLPIKVEVLDPELDHPDQEFQPESFLAFEEDMDQMDSDAESDDSDFHPKQLSLKKARKERKYLSSKTPKVPPVRLKPKMKKKNNVSKQLRKTSRIVNEKHENWDGTVKAFACKICPTTYPTLRNFKRHMEDHEKCKEQLDEFICKECGYPSLSSKAREIHITVKHREGEDRLTQLACSLCPFVAASKQKLLRHMKEHKDASDKECVNGKFLCKFCDRLFMSYVLLCRHQRIAHHKEMGWEPIVCKLCTRIFSTHKHLRDHIQQTHQKQSKFYCEKCGRGFLYMSKLRRHVNTHARENIYICEVCGADFLYAETLRSHVRKNHPEGELAENRNDPNKVEGDSESSAKYVCKHCNVELGSSTLLFRHIKSHKELFQHECDICGKNYATVQSLRRHLDINHTEKQIACPYCDKKFPHQEYVRAHFRHCSQHPDKRESDKVLGEPVDISLLPGRSNCDGEIQMPDSIVATVVKSEEL